MTASVASSKRNRGRPRKWDPADARGNVSIRMRAEMKAKIAASAAANGRSISEEIEFRLEALALLRPRQFGWPEFEEGA